MPIKIDGYKCEKCNYVHSSFEGAAACENKHGQVFVYEPEFEQSSVGPYSIKCTFIKANGEEFTRNYY